MFPSIATIKTTQRLLFIFLMSFFSVSYASHIRLSPTASFYTAGNPLTGIGIGIANENTENKGTENEDAENKSREAIPNEDAADKTFNQELQWRILNLLAQQLFQNTQSSLDNAISNNWLYSTDTFSVNITSTNPDVYLVNIIDTQLGSETQLEIPHL